MVHTFLWYGTFFNHRWHLSVWIRLHACQWRPLYDTDEHLRRRDVSKWRHMQRHQPLWLPTRLLWRRLFRWNWITIFYTSPCFALLIYYLVHAKILAALVMFYKKKIAYCATTFVSPSLRRRMSGHQLRSQRSLSTEQRWFKPMLVRRPSLGVVTRLFGGDLLVWRHVPERRLMRQVRVATRDN